ncbi:N-lysine methyltransferase [Trifolium repens]|nr:N-lysine methyltransferase [Trifolium repens]
MQERRSKGRLFLHVLPLSPLRLFEPRAWGLWTELRPNSKIAQLSNPCFPFVLQKGFFKRVSLSFVSTINVCFWLGIADSPTPPSSATRSHQPLDGISKVVFGDQVTDEEVES